MFLIWKSKTPERGVQYQRNLSYLTDVQWDIFDLPYVRNKEYQY